MQQWGKNCAGVVLTTTLECLTTTLECLFGFRGKEVPYRANAELRNGHVFVQFSVFIMLRQSSWVVQQDKKQQRFRRRGPHGEARTRRPQEHIITRRRISKVSPVVPSLSFLFSDGLLQHPALPREEELHHFLWVLAILEAFLRIPSRPSD